MIGTGMKRLVQALAAALALVSVNPALAQAPLPLTEGRSRVAHPVWAERAVIYEVNIRQYTPEGTFKAFEKHLPRLKKLGVNALWIMPIHPISQKERKGSLGSYYAVRDYYGVNPEFGTLAEFQQLVKAAHKQGFKVIIDWVANHTGWDNVWVEQHPSWYIRNPKGELEGYNYTDLSTGKKETWADVIGLDYRKPEVREGMIDAMSYWVKVADIDGFRCDVAWTLPVEFWDQARTRLDAIKPMFMLAEADTPELQMNAFDMTYDWTLFRLLIKVSKGEADARDLTAYYTAPARRYPAGAFRMNFTSNHDENSWHGTEQELFGGASEAMAVLSATLPGMPLVYSGQEAGLNKRLEFFEKDQIEWKPSGRADVYAGLFDLKRRHPALSNSYEPGNLQIIDAGNPKVFAFRRIKGKDKVTVIVNLSATPARIKLPGVRTANLAGWGWNIAPGK